MTRETVVQRSIWSLSQLVQVARTRVWSSAATKVTAGGRGALLPGGGGGPDQGTRCTRGRGPARCAASRIAGPGRQLCCCSCAGRSPLQGRRSLVVVSLVGRRRGAAPSVPPLGPPAAQVRCIPPLTAHHRWPAPLLPAREQDHNLPWTRPRHTTCTHPGTAVVPPSAAADRVRHGRAAGGNRGLGRRARAPALSQPRSQP